MSGFRFFVKTLTVESRLRLTGDLTPVGISLELSKEDHHHARDVLRLPAGTEVEVIVPELGQRYIASLEYCDQRAYGKISARASNLEVRNPVTHLALASCKGDTNGFVIEKCCELGVEFIHLWIGERSISRWDDGDQKKLQRFMKIAEAGSKQCGRGDIPSIHLHRSLDALLKSLGEISPIPQLVFGALTPDANNPKNLSPNLQDICFIVGPEGDFSARELEQLRAREAKPLGLGKLVLRSETAAISGIVTINTICTR